MKSATRSDSSPFYGAVHQSVFPPTGGIAKRAFDVSAACLGLIFLSPLFLMVMLLVKLSDRGPIFYGHRRIGHNGQEFRCLKFRTMVTNGDKVLQEHLRNNPKAMEEWRETRKLQDDPRVTVVGAVLRKLSLDELPQLFNIIRGEMSVVGPRPVVRDELEKYENAAVYYLQARPGLTGLWQISGRNDVSYATRVAFDTHYVENWSLVRDVVIIARTIPAVCAQRGSY
ncbi:exopolysaccharide biosynthesis protein [Rhizobium altiplani]|uniref:Exopolysaccharide biosynthesis protein n=1 Tax=Rhizobium altiplani TaxID=1864509 RepID=A0A109JMP7_9HYPH|nr:sugar transferase [Rhizobium altiplani]KWV51643.1 exopolysaccharide biosynthesis protein [Rhizobium altiplani]